MKTKELYIVGFESLNYCGAGSHCLVWATSEDKAKETLEISGYADNEYREQDYDQFVEENGEEEAEYTPWASITSAELVTGSDYEEYVNDPSQASFYPYINSK